MANPKRYWVQGKEVDVDEYNRLKYDSIVFRVKKGYKEQIKKFAEQHGMSMNQFIVGAIFNEMEQEDSDKK